MPQAPSYNNHRHAVDRSEVRTLVEIVEMAQLGCCLLSNFTLEKVEAVKIVMSYYPSPAGLDCDRDYEMHIL